MRGLRRKPRLPAAPEGYVRATDAELGEWYTDEERTVLARAYGAMVSGDEDAAQAIARTVGCYLVDGRLVGERLYREYTTTQGRAAVRVESALRAEDYAAADAEFHAYGFDIADWRLMGRIGFMDRFRETGGPEDSEGPEDLTPAEEHFPPLARPAGDTERVRVFSLPDGTDHTDPVVQRRTEQKIRASWGESWVVMWPRYPDVEDGIDPVFTVVNTRPYLRAIAWGVNTKPNGAQDVAAQGGAAGHGALVEFDPHRKHIAFADLDPETVALRARLAMLLNCHPHEVELALHHETDKHTGQKRLDQVVIVKAPSLSVDPEKRKAVWSNLVANIEGGSSGWQHVEDPVAMVTRLRYGQPRTLPGLVPMIDLLPDDYNPNRWGQIPFGKDPEGRVAFIDMELGPHILLVGPSGTGKTIAMLQITTAALIAGYQVCVVDAAKRGADYKRLKPWTSAWARTNLEAGAVLKAAYAESQRRADIIDAYDEDHWSKLPPEVLERENIAPLLVVIDEYQSFNEIEKPSAGLDKDSAEYAQIVAMNEAKAAVVTATRRLVAEARWAGVYVCIGTQRAPSETIPVTMRDNIHWKIQLAQPGKPITPSTLGLTFPGDQVAEAAEVKVELDDGMSRGLALVAGDGGSVVGVRVGLANKPELPGYLEERDVPKPTSWDLPEPETVPVAGERISPSIPANLWGRTTPAAPVASAAPAVVDLAEIELSMDDLMLDEEVDDTFISTPAPTVSAPVVANDEEFDFETPAARPAPAASNDDWWDDDESVAKPAPPVADDDLWS